MPDFNLNDITELLRQIKSVHPMLNLNVEGFQSSAEESLKDFITTREGNNIYRKPAVPSNYSNRELEFFIVYHLSKQFFEGVLETEFITKEFQNISEVDKIEMVNEEGITINNLEIKNVDVEALSNDVRKLRKLFDQLGKALLGDDFNYRNFLNQE
ncbi:hypothetical protein SAMN05216464_110119 [Mucilaginibacter pineti]|uniref:Uncharacterized protein n=1 Tax=Mucilaginibacter pineti TaxID=1391627 RepID=A0A1G7GFF1_9SPHI|nr:hypothetical protein [Mucilaginibacter pineti]SDE86846.1 hypothetical protein SAMN05216464_110119 [Mucilaginibacter pineti]